MLTTENKKTKICNHKLDDVAIIPELNNIYSKKTKAAVNTFLKNIIEKYRKEPERLLKSLAKILDLDEIDELSAMRNESIVYQASKVTVNDENLLLKFARKIAVYSSKAAELNLTGRYFEHHLSQFFQGVSTKYLFYKYSDHCLPKKESSSCPYYEQVYAYAAEQPAFSAVGELYQKTLINLGNQEAKQKLVKSNLKLVLNIVKELDCQDISEIDQIAVGVDALASAVEKWNPQQHRLLSEFAKEYIEDSINDYIVEERELYPESVLSSSRDLRSLMLLEAIDPQYAQGELINVRPYFPEEKVDSDGKLSVNFILGDKQFINLNRFTNQKVMISSGESRGYQSCLVVSSKEVENLPPLIVAEAGISQYSSAYRPLLRYTSIRDSQKQPGDFLSNSRPEQDCLFPAWRDALVATLPNEVSNQQEFRIALSLLSELGKFKARDQEQADEIFARASEIIRQASNQDLVVKDLKPYLHKTIKHLAEITFKDFLTLQVLDYPNAERLWSEAKPQGPVRFYAGIVEGQGKKVFAMLPVKIPDLLESNIMDGKIRAYSSQKGDNFYLELLNKHNGKEMPIHRYLIYSGELLPKIRTEKAILRDYLLAKSERIPQPDFFPFQSASKVTEDGGLVLSQNPYIRISSLNNLTGCKVYLLPGKSEGYSDSIFVKSSEDASEVAYYLARSTNRGAFRPVFRADDFWSKAQVNQAAYLCRTLRNFSDSNDLLIRVLSETFRHEEINQETYRGNLMLLDAILDLDPVAKPENLIPFIRRLGFFYDNLAEVYTFGKTDAEIVPRFRALLDWIPADSRYTFPEENIKAQDYQGTLLSRPRLTLLGEKSLGLLTMLGMENEIEKFQDGTLHVVAQFAKKFTFMGFSVDELISFAMPGHRLAIKYYHPSKGNHFAGFAKMQLKYSIYREARKNNQTTHIPKEIHLNIAKIKEAISLLPFPVYDLETDAELVLSKLQLIAPDKWSKAKLLEYEHYLHIEQAVSFDQPYGDEESTYADHYGAEDPNFELLADL